MQTPLLLQCFLPWQATHCEPLIPHWASLVVVTQVLPWQQPVQLFGVQVAGSHSPLLQTLLPRQGVPVVQQG